MSENPKWFQKLFYKETVLAIKSSLDFLSYESFKNDLVLLLPQESKKSRIRIANNILHRFFPDKKLYNFLPQIWEIYQDEELLREIIRYELLNQEPIIADFVANHILNKPAEEGLPPKIFSDYIKQVYGKEIENLSWWLQSTVRDLGFISKNKVYWQINDIKIPETAFMLLLHKIFAPYPDKINIEAILENNFWKILGIRNDETVINILYKAHLLNILDFKEGIIETKYSIESLCLSLKTDLI
ncbi:MAG: hypothetical protein A2287_04650 [Candidatus Melainabacteria bacterium RIFOXYA12_FULL_32_12]|nr:MAG: hypothetical protein A2255_02660 [Candidatus Melainabacteria bacterium RIFOXYA2_FULL_32_9]OGI26779.1 MAG: hypothetical protein A2287_04650 [Candidatus Melainabacteria bacterium RIFOXYA12_FULL_32_12]